MAVQQNKCLFVMMFGEAFFERGIETPRWRSPTVNCFALHESYQEGWVKARVGFFFCSVIIIETSSVSLLKTIYVLQAYLICCWKLSETVCTVAVHSIGVVMLGKERLSAVSNNK